jgi:hypothetical protein
MSATSILPSGYRIRLDFLDKILDPAWIAGPVIISMPAITGSIA